MLQCKTSRRGTIPNERSDIQIAEFIARVKQDLASECLGPSGVVEFGAGDAIVGRIDHRHLGATPFRPLKTRAVVLILLGAELSMKLADTLDNHADMSAWRSAAVMFRDVKLDACAADLHIKRHAGLEAMLPVHGETEEVDIELARLGFVDAAQHRRF